MAQFFQFEGTSISKCDSYDQLTSLVAYSICRNTVTQLVPNIIETIDRLGVDSSCDKFIDCLANIYPGYAYTESFNTILHHLANKIANNIDSMIFDPDEVSILITFIFADDKSFYNKMSNQLKDKLFLSIFKYIISYDLYNQYRQITDDPNVDQLFRYLDDGFSLIINNSIYDINGLPFSDARRSEEIKNLCKNNSINFLSKELFKEVIKIVQNLDISYHMDMIAKNLWLFKKEQMDLFIRTQVMKLYNISAEKENLMTDVVLMAFAWINGFNVELSPLLAPQYKYDNKNIYSEMAKFPVVGKYIYSFMEDIYNFKKYLGLSISDGKNSGVLYYIYMMCYQQYWTLKASTVNETVMGFIRQILDDYNLEIHEDIFMTEKYSDILSKYKNTEDGKYLSWNFSYATEASSKYHSRHDYDEEDDSDNEHDDDQDDDYDGPEIEAKQSSKGQKKGSKIQSEGERKIYKAYKKYKNAESKVDSQLSKMLSSAKNAFRQDKTEEIIEGKKFTPIGLLKKILITGAIFSYSKIAGFLYLIVGHTLSKKRTNAQRMDIINQMNEEIKLLDEKIEDARGDGNRKAKYALMRTRGEIVRARDKIKYGLSASKQDMQTAKNYISADRSDKDR